MDPAFLNRGVNEGFSGGEKKRNEILQMAMLEPDLAILDETDSGLDIDALKAVAAACNALRDPSRAIVLVTHYQRLLDYVEPDFVHVLSEGKIVRSGDKSLALDLEEKGYEWIREAANAMNSPRSIRSCSRPRWQRCRQTTRTCSDSRGSAFFERRDFPRRETRTGSIRIFPPLRLPATTG